MSEPIPGVRTGHEQYLNKPLDPNSPPPVDKDGKPWVGVKGGRPCFGNPPARLGHSSPREAQHYSDLFKEQIFMEWAITGRSVPYICKTWGVKVPTFKQWIKRYDWRRRRNVMQEKLLSEAKDTPHAERALAIIKSGGGCSSGTAILAAKVEAKLETMLDAIPSNPLAAAMRDPATGKDVSLHDYMLNLTAMIQAMKQLALTLRSLYGPKPINVKPQPKPVRPDASRLIAQGKVDTDFVPTPDPDHATP